MLARFVGPPRASLCFGRARRSASSCLVSLDVVVNYTAWSRYARSSPSTLQHDQWAHHVVLLVLENVAVPHVLVPSSSGAHRIPHALRQSRELELRDDGEHLTGV